MPSAGLSPNTGAFPDIKGQAPLRQGRLCRTSLARCDLFLTSKVRLHCDSPREPPAGSSTAAFPDLKGQAPLRRPDGHQRLGRQGAFPDLKGQAPLRLLIEQIRQHTETTFPDLKGQAPLRLPGGCLLPSGPGLFLTSKVRLHCDREMMKSCAFPENFS